MKIFIPEGCLIIAQRFNVGCWAQRRLSPVAQTSSLLYRGFPIRQRCEVCKPCRLEVGDTAGWKPALLPPRRSRADKMLKRWAIVACPSGTGASRNFAVAQTSSLPYRGFPIRPRCEVCKPCRLEVGDTAGWKPALLPL